MTDQHNLFDTRAMDGNQLAPPSGDGSTPIRPLQIYQPKQLRLAVIDNTTARKIWLEKHYLHRDPVNVRLHLGVFSPDMAELVGAISFSVRMGGSKDGGTPHIWEIRRMWLSDEQCARNSESRVLAVACHMIKKLVPHVRYIVSYSDTVKMKHKGTIYKAAGFRYDGMTGGSTWLSHSRHPTADDWPKKRWIKWLK